MGNRKTKNQSRETASHAEVFAQIAAIKSIRFEQIANPKFHGFYNLQTLLDYLKAVAETGERKALVYNLPVSMLDAIRLEKFGVACLDGVYIDHGHGHGHTSTKWLITW